MHSSSAKTRSEQSSVLCIAGPMIQTVISLDSQQIDYLIGKNKLTHIYSPKYKNMRVPSLFINDEKEFAKLYKNAMKFAQEPIKSPSKPRKKIITPYKRVMGRGVDLALNLCNFGLDVTYAGKTGKNIDDGTPDLDGHHFIQMISKAGVSPALIESEKNVIQRKTTEQTPKELNDFKLTKGPATSSCLTIYDLDIGVYIHLVYNGASKNFEIPKEQPTSRHDRLHRKHIFTLPGEKPNQIFRNGDIQQKHSFFGKSLDFKSIFSDPFKKYGIVVLDGSTAVSDEISNQTMLNAIDTAPQDVTTIFTLPLIAINSEVSILTALLQIQNTRKYIHNIIKGVEAAEELTNVKTPTIVVGNAMQFLFILNPFSTSLFSADQKTHYNEDPKALEESAANYYLTHITDPKDRDYVYSQFPKDTLNIVTLGHHGVLVVDTKSTHKDLPMDQKMFILPPIKALLYNKRPDIEELKEEYKANNKPFIIDSRKTYSGGGLAFLSAFIDALSQGANLEECIRYGQGTAYINLESPPNKIEEFSAVPKKTATTTTVPTPPPPPPLPKYLTTNSDVELSATNSIDPINDTKENTFLSTTDSINTTHFIDNTNLQTGHDDVGIFK